MLRDPATVARLLDSPCLAELDLMIARAEAACLRYRRSADEGGLSPASARRRRSQLETMEAALGRLRRARRRAHVARRAPPG